MGRSVSDVTFQQKEKPLVVNRDVKLVDPSDLYLLIYFYHHVK